jgi:carboxypeptidase Taq
MFIPQLSDVDAEEFYRAVNKVQPSTIRVEADEVTYNFHIMLRVEIEMAMLDGTLPVNDVAEFWRAKMREYLGVTPPDDAEGALQDIHWSSGSFGTFCTYSIGNIMSVQLFEAARKADPGMDAALAAGNYAPLLAWLTANMYRHGRAFSAEEILQRATGQGLTTGPYLGYLNKKFGELYPA